MTTTGIHGIYYIKLYHNLDAKIMPIFIFSTNYLSKVRGSYGVNVQVNRITTTFMSQNIGFYKYNHDFEII